MIPIAQFVSSTPPPSPCTNNTYKCLGATLTISFQAGDINAVPASSVTIYASREDDPPYLIGNLFAQIFQSEGQYTLQNLISDTTYKITLINNFEQVSDPLYLKTPRHGGEYIYIQPINPYLS